MATKRRLAARTPASYDSRVHGKRESYIPAGDHTLNLSVATVNLVKPKYKDGPMVFRPFPHLSYEDPENQLQPGRSSGEPGAYTHWHIKVKCAYFVGTDDPKTFILYHPKDAQDKKNSNPFMVFYWAAKRAYDSGAFGTGQSWDPQWNKLFKGTKKEGAKIDKPANVYFFQGAVYTNGDRNYMEEKDREKPYGLGPNDDLTVIQAKGSGGGSAIEVLDRTLDEYEGDPETDFNAPFEFGDPVGKFLAKKRVVAGGVFIEIFNPKVTKIEGANSSWDGKIADVQGYEAAILKEFELNGTTYKPRLDTSDVDFIFNKCQFWFDDEKSKEKGLLNIASDEEQAVWLAQAFRSVPKLVSYAFSERDELLTDDVKGILAARVSSVVPGEDDEEEEDKGKKKVKKDPTLAGKKPKPKDEDEEEDEDEEGDEDGRRRGGRGRGGRGEAGQEAGKKPAKDEDEEEEEEEGDEEGDEDEDEDEEGDEDDEKRRKRSRRRSREEAGQEGGRGRGGGRRGRGRKRTRRVTRTKTRTRRVTRRKRKRKRKEAKKPSKKPKDEEEEDEDEPKAKAPKTGKSGKKGTSDDEDYFEEEPTEKAMKAAKGAKDRSEKRSTPEKAPPAPPAKKKTKK
jgi:hypothetical protein